MSTAVRLILGAFGTLLGALLIAPEALLVWPTFYVVGVSIPGISPSWVRLILWVMTWGGGALIALGVSTLIRSVRPIRPH